ncbi:MAG: hypothetical protein WBP46_00935 [Thiolinea sp.]
MDNRRDTKGWLKSIEQGLNREADNLSPQVQTRLQQVRQRAMAEFNSQQLPKAQTGWLAWLTKWQPVDFKSGAVLAGLVGVTVLAVGMQVTTNHSSDNSLSISEAKPNNSTDVLMSNEDIDFLENMDIYEWLAAEYS